MRMFERRQDQDPENHLRGIFIIRIKFSKFGRFSDHFAGYFKNKKKEKKGKERELLVVSNLHSQII